MRFHQPPLFVDCVGVADIHVAGEGIEAPPFQLVTLAATPNFRGYVDPPFDTIDSVNASVFDSPSRMSFDLRKFEYPVATLGNGVRKLTL